MVRQCDDCRSLRSGCRCHLGLEFGKAMLKLLPFLGELLFAGGSQFSGGGQVSVRALCGSLSLSTLSSVVCHQLLCSGNLVLRGNQRFAQTFKLSTKVTFYLTRIRGWEVG